MLTEDGTVPVHEAASCPQTFSIVGVGASAGGLEACSALLRHLPVDTGLACVVIQHLDPKHESLLPALLARTTRIPVKTVQDEMVVEPNQIYVMPPNWEILFSEGLLRLIPRGKSPDGVRMPIDLFFRSLAENCQHRAIGVVLSGTGSDGALGLEAIKAAGGFTFAQDVKSAKFEGMPQSAFATGSVDFVLPPEGIALELARIAKFPYVERISSVVRTADVAQERSSLQCILSFLHKTAGIDFAQYRSTTIQRRVLRRMAINHISDPDDYCRFLKETSGEVQLLCEEMIPRVTRFFRDPEVFVALQKVVFPRLLQNRTADEPLRIWVPGCASGEEVYAIAICLLEFRKETDHHLQIQIFGTDLSGLAIQTARRGLYPDKIAEDVSPERLQRFFVKRDEGYQVSSAIREMCVFAGHDLISDPPYSKLDLISCRNVLIYLDSIQSRILPVFHYALKPGGFLMLGVMETATRFAELFTPVDKHSQIYSKKPVSGRGMGGWGTLKIAGPSTSRKTGDNWQDADVQKRADRAVLSRYAPGGVVVNENWQVVQVRGQVTPYLEPASGKMTANVLAMAKQSGLAPDLAAALEQAKKQNAPVRKEHLAIRHGGANVSVEVIPLALHGDDARLFLVLFERVPAVEFATPDNTAEESSVSKRDFLKMQQELVATRERLVTMLDTHQQYSDETQSVQEENLSNLEEVQSFNEELETAKEELQSTNEELSTVNEELQVRNADLQQARDFAASIVETVLQPLVVLDNLLNVKKANRAFYHVFRLSESDTEARPIYELAQRAWDVPELRKLLEKVVLDSRPSDELELEILFPQAGRKTVRINAQRLKFGDMVLMSIDDITARKQAEEELARVQDELRQGQKMEAIGRLAGGVAHDFNNMLTGILGFSEMLMTSVPKDGEAFQQASEIRKAGERAATLTHQLLAFSRRQLLHPQVLDLNNVIRELEQMLRRLIGDSIVLQENFAKDLRQVHADPGQMSQVVLNLALNARDAMPYGGTLLLGTENTRVEEGGAKVRGLEPGNYVTLTVGDTGAGMDLDTQQHLFEPFFTTKPQGAGTGLGLATVAGIVGQSGGQIHFESRMKAGTTFWVDLPALATGAVTKLIGSPDQMPRGTETILLVEDEAVVRRLANLLLRRQGYTVIEAANAGDALQVWKSRSAEIDLVVSDVDMPGGMNGRQLSEQFRQTVPNVRILLMSGHTTDSLVHYGVKKGAPFLQKPFTLLQLASKVREILDV